MPQDQDERRGADERAEIGSDVSDFGDERPEDGGGNVEDDGYCPGNGKGQFGLEFERNVRLRDRLEAVLELLTTFEHSEGDERDEDGELREGEDASETEAAEHGRIVYFRMAIVY